MNKSDLRTGWIVTTRTGRKFMVFLNFNHCYDNSTDILLNPDGEASWNDLSIYTEDLKHHDYDGDDIVKIESPRHAYDVFKKNREYCCIWKREEPKEMTVEEIQQALGYKIKVVESKVK